MTGISTVVILTNQILAREHEDLHILSDVIRDIAEDARQLDERTLDDLEEIFKLYPEHRPGDDAILEAIRYARPERAEELAAIMTPERAQFIIAQKRLAGKSPDEIRADAELTDLMQFETEFMTNNFRELFTPTIQNNCPRIDRIEFENGFVSRVEINVRNTQEPDLLIERIRNVLRDLEAPVKLYLHTNLHPENQWAIEGFVPEFTRRLREEVPELSKVSGIEFGWINYGNRNMNNFEAFSKVLESPHLTRLEKVHIDNGHGNSPATGADEIERLVERAAKLPRMKEIKMMRIAPTDMDIQAMLPKEKVLKVTRSDRPKHGDNTIITKAHISVVKNGRSWGPYYTYPVDLRLWTRDGNEVDININAPAPVTAPPAGDDIAIPGPDYGLDAIEAGSPENTLPVTIPEWAQELVAETNPAPEVPIKGKPESARASGFIARAISAIGRFFGGG